MKNRRKTIDAAVLRAARKKRIASRTTKAQGEPADLPEDPEEPAEDMEEASSAFNYNPLYQKPTHLGQDRPSGGYHYYGPPPDAGTSYGYYVDAENNIGIIAPIAKTKRFSPVSGKPMKLQGKIETDALATVMAVASEMSRFTVGGKLRMTSAGLRKVKGDIFDPMTGDEISESLAEDEEPMLDEELPLEDEMSLEEEPIEEEAQLPPMMAQEEELLLEDPMEEPMEEAQEEELPLEELPMEGSDDEDADDEPGMEELPLEGSDDEDADDEPGMEEEEVESVEYEALQSLDDLDESLAEEDVHMTLFNEGTPEAPGADPYWNIDIGGQPIARVYLKDQPKPEEIRQVFCSADYYRGVAGAISKVGIRPVLLQIKAHAWANKVEQTKLAKGIKAKVDAEAKQRVEALTKNLMRDLLQRIAVVCAGMDKNFYKDVGNPLKEALWGEMHKYGTANPSPIIEASFRRGATKYFQTVLSKAVEYMEMEPVALEQIQNAIGDMDVIPPGGESVGEELPEVDPENAATLNERLAASSVAIGGMPGISGDPIGDHKSRLKGELSLGGAGPRR